MKKAAKRNKVERVPETLVRYYKEGWRYGHLIGIEGPTALIRPIAAHLAPPARVVRVPRTDVYEEPVTGVLK